LAQRSRAPSAPASDSDDFVRFISGLLRFGCVKVRTRVAPHLGTVVIVECCCNHDREFSFSGSFYLVEKLTMRFSRNTDRNHSPTPEPAAGD